MNHDRMKERYIDREGYILVKSSNHYHRRKGGFIYDHIAVLEKALGRRILESECCHHIDGNRQNNYIGNLMLFKTKSMHRRFHEGLRAYEACGHYDWRMCCYCHKYDDKANLTYADHNRNSFHQKCKGEYMKQLRRR